MAHLGPLHPRPWPAIWDFPGETAIRQVPLQSGGFDQWVKSGDSAIKQRILDYNEDDCRATRVLRDGIEKLPIQ